MKKTVLVLTLTLITLIAVSQTKTEYKKLKVDFFTKALINSTSCDKIAEILSDEFNLENTGGMYIFKHKTDERMSFMYKQLGQNGFMYTWSEKENRLSDFRVYYDKSIQQLGFDKIIDKSNELTYRLCDKSLILTITHSSYTGKVSCDLVMYPEHALIKYACKPNSSKVNKPDYSSFQIPINPEKAVEPGTKPEIHDDNLKSITFSSSSVLHNWSLDENSIWTLKLTTTKFILKNNNGVNKVFSIIKNEYDEQMTMQKFSLGNFDNKITHKLLVSWSNDRYALLLIKIDNSEDYQFQDTQSIDKQYLNLKNE